MIYDKIENIENYKGNSRWLDEAISFIISTDLSAIELGKTIICSDKVFANVMEATAVNEEDISYEIHKKYMDIQIDIEGVECVKIGLDVEKVIDEYKEEIDFGRVLCQESASCTLGAGRFVICMAQEPHKPSIAAAQDRRLKKCVIKVAVE